MVRLLLVFSILASLHAGDRFLTGQDYRKWSDSGRVGYVAGYLGGYESGRQRAGKNLVTVLTPNTWKQVVEQLNDKEDPGAACFSGKQGEEAHRSIGQAMAVLDKYIADHPESWDKQIGQLAEEAFIDACEKRAKKP